MTPSIGSLSLLPASGRLGLVVGAQAVGTPDDGRQLMALKIKSIDRAGEARGDAPPQTAGRPWGDSVAREAAEQKPVAPQTAASDQRSAALREGAGGPEPGARSYDQLSAEERAAVDRLRQRDSQVRLEDEAHAAVAGDLAGPISYVYQRGPDGRLYAVGGSVPIKAQAVSGNPEEAKRLGARIAAAAHAATNPSDADLAAANRGYGLQAGRAAQRRGSAIDVSA